MFRNVFLKTLHDQWKMTFWFAIALAATALYAAVLYPTISETSGITELIENLPEFFQELIGGAEAYTTPEGFMNAEVYSIFAPVVILVYAVIRGSGAIAGEEQAHTLDLLLANPISRERVLLEKAAALLVGVALLSFSLWAALTIGAAIANFDLSQSGLLQASVSITLVAWSFGMLALAGSAATGRKGLSAGIAGGVAIVSWFLQAFQPLVDWMEPSRFATLFYYYNDNDVILNGLVAGHALALAGLSAAALTLAVLAFRRRDLRT